MTSTFAPDSTRLRPIFSGRTTEGRCSRSIEFEDARPDEGADHLHAAGGGAGAAPTKPSTSSIPIAMRGQ